MLSLKAPKSDPIRDLQPAVVFLVRGSTKRDHFAQLWRCKFLKLLKHAVGITDARVAVFEDKVQLGIRRQTPLKHVGELGQKEPKANSIFVIQGDTLWLVAVGVVTFKVTMVQRDAEAAGAVVLDEPLNLVDIANLSRFIPPFVFALSVNKLLGVVISEFVALQ